MRLKSLVAAFALAAAFAAPVPGLHAQEQGGRLVFMSTPFPNLDPLAAPAASGYVAGQLFTTLTRLDDDWTPLPNLADSWETSDDGLVYTFKINSEANFHDGKPITSADVKFSLETAVKTHRFGPAMFGQVKQIETPDEKTVVFKLDTPNPALLRSASNPRFLPILAKHVYGTQDEYNTHPAHNQPVGSGPFKLGENRLPEYVTLVRNEDYWRDGRPYLDEVIFRVVTDQTAVRIGFERGDFHMTVGSANALYRDMKRFQDMPNLSVDICCEANGSIFVMDVNNRNGPLKDARVREAISLAIDREFIASRLHDGWTKPGVGPIVSASPFAAPDAQPLPFDIEKANALLDEAGFPRGNGGIRFELSLIHLSSFRDLMVTVAEYLVPQLAKVGIKVNREQMPDSPSWSRRVADWNYDLALSLPGNYHDPLVGVSRMFVCDNIKNVAYANTGGYCNPEVDELFSKAAVAPDEDERKQLYSDVQKILIRDMPAIWVLENPAPLIYDNRLVNPVLSGWGPSGPMDETYWSERSAR